MRLASKKTLLVALLLASTPVACTLITEVDRSKIVDDDPTGPSTGGSGMGGDGMGGDGIGGTPVSTGGSDVGGAGGDGGAGGAD